MEAEEFVPAPQQSRARGTTASSGARGGAGQRKKASRGGAAASKPAKQPRSKRARAGRDQHEEELARQAPRRCVEADYASMLADGDDAGLHGMDIDD